MSRGSSLSVVRKISPDPLYGSVILAKILNNAMYQGKRNVVTALVYQALDLAINDITEASAKNNPDHKDGDHVAIVKWFMEFMLGRCMLNVELRSRRMGGSNYRIPTPISRGRAVSIAIKRIVAGARLRKEKGFDRKLAGEFKDIIAGEGEALKKKALLQRDIDANRAFAHYAK